MNSDARECWVIVGTALGSEIDMKDLMTEKEETLYNGIKDGMDEANCGWLHEIIANIGWKECLATNGVLGSLVKKGLVNSYKDTEGPEVCYWVEIAEA